MFPVNQQEKGLYTLARKPNRSRTPTIFRMENAMSERSQGMTWKRVVPALALVCVFGGAATPLFAQAVQTTVLTGTIKDTTGGVLPGVTVNVSSPTQVGGVQTATADSEG